MSKAGRPRRGKRDGPRSSSDNLQLEPIDFDTLLEEMSEHLSRDPGDSFDTDDEITEEITSPFKQEEGFEDTAERDTLQDSASIDIDLVQDGERATSVTEDVTLAIQFSVQVAAGDGDFNATEATGLLVGARSYPIVLLDELAFGFDSRRNDFEIVLDGSTAALTLKELETEDPPTLLIAPDGHVRLTKPKGLRLDVYSVDRTDDGQRHMTSLGSVPAVADTQIVLPTQISSVFDESEEFMLGLGLTDEEKLCYAFSVYLAVRLERP